jgi:predicted RNase H-like HicB family nuclease
MTQLTIIYEQGDCGWWIATIPEIPGTFSQGKSRCSAKRNVISAANELMSARRKAAIKMRTTASVVERVRLTV